MCVCVCVCAYIHVFPPPTNLFHFHLHLHIFHCSDEFKAVVRDAMDPCNILFSSGTTGEPKAIVWSHSTPIKCAIDGYLHQDIKEGENVVWPTNIGWMMGPFILFQLINGATVGIFNGITSTNAFCEYVQASQMNMVGVIPSLVKAWQANGATDKCDWSCVRRFSSTGEASDPRNMLWLMSRVPGYAPVIEYCGGTEIGGSYMSSTLVQPNVPSLFSSPVLGSQLVLLDPNGDMQEGDGYAGEQVREGGEAVPAPARSDSADVGEGSGRARSYSGVDLINPGPVTTTVVGELTLVPPAMGLSTHLLNRNHYDTYFGGMPAGKNGEILRRHGDEVELVKESAFNVTPTGTHADAFPVTGSYYRALGRCDDTMNLGGIKISSVEIERVCNTTAGVHETAAIAITPPSGGPSLLLIYVVTLPSTPAPAAVAAADAASMSVSDLLKSQVTPASTTLPPTASTPAPAPASASASEIPTEEAIADLKKAMQMSIKTRLNPLFHIFKVIHTQALPRTASNKIMRRVLRDQYMAKEHGL